MARIAHDNGALFMVDIAHYAGLVEGGVYPNPVPHADFVTSTTHKSMRGPRGGVIMMKSQSEKRSEAHTFELQALMRRSFAVLCLKKKHHYTTPVYRKLQNE